jgi:hypothetical protein
MTSAETTFVKIKDSLFRTISNDFAKIGTEAKKVEGFLGKIFKSIGGF